MSARFTRRSLAASVGLGAAGLLSRPWWALADDGPSDGDLDVFVRTRMELAHVPGLSLAIIRDGKLLRATGFGFANLAQQRPMLADTLINIASVTKTATCIAVMQLWERKKFALEGDVNAHLSFPVRNSAYPEVPMTFRQLLAHTSSIADGPDYDRSYAFGDPLVSLGQWLRDYLTPSGRPIASADQDVVLFKRAPPQAAGAGMAEKSTTARKPGCSFQDPRPPGRPAKPPDANVLG